jgi:lantibiotic modifying enzyme
MNERQGGKNMREYRRLGLVVCFTLFFLSCDKQESYVNEINLVARWIRASAVQTENGTTWPAVPGDNDTINNTLYSGTPGVVLFFLEAFHATGDMGYLDDARVGADYLLATLEKEKGAGLYVGLSGIGYCLEETYKATKEGKYRKGAVRCLDILDEWAEEKEKGIQWGETTDIISGNAGTGLFLLHLAAEWEDESVLARARLVGDQLLDVGIPAEEGTKWAMNPQYPRLMPNFSHGTAGIAYFLASLYQRTKEQKYLDGALAGAAYLKSVAKTDDDGCMIFHHEPEGEDLFYLGWCHGPVGTARLFYRLYQITENREWMQWVEKGARGILDSGIPDREVPGFWNNVGVCCGSAGVAEFYLNLFQVTEKSEYLDFAKELTEQILNKATRDDSGMWWVHAEHRSQPDFLQAQTNLMQGAAGIGLWLLRLEEYEKGQAPLLVLPDNPFRSPLISKEKKENNITNGAGKIFPIPFLDVALAE